MSTTALGSTVAPWKIYQFNVAGRWLSARELVAQDKGWALGDPRVEIEFSRVQGDWYPRRLAFEQHWLSGEHFIYGALVYQGAGLAVTPRAGYGDFTLVVHDPAACSPHALAAFPGNTAHLYGMTGALDVRACEEAATAWPRRGDLLVVKHAADTRVMKRSDWGHMVCDEVEFSEGVWAGDLGLDTIDEVRVPEALWDSIQDEETLPIAHRTPAIELRLRAWEILHEWSSSHGVTMVKV